MAFQLRDYQLDVINGCRESAARGHRRILAVMSTGAGKTVVAAEMIRRTVVGAGRRTMFCVDKDVLVGQTYNKVSGMDLGAECGFIKAGWPEDPKAPIQIASFQTMESRRWWQSLPPSLHPDVIFFDESHISSFRAVSRQILEVFPRALLIGLTATPFRLKKKEGMGDIFTDLVLGPLPGELIDKGWLAKPRYLSLSHADLKGVRTRAGDYAQGDLSARCNTGELIEKVLVEWFDHAQGKRTLAFCVDVAHAQAVAAAFRRRGVAAACVDGSTPLDERRHLYNALRDGDLTVLTSCDVISIGFDEPSAEVGLMLRPTKSAALHFQQLGRLLRISPETGKTEALILDQAGNVPKLGRAEDLTTEMISLQPGRAPTSMEAATKVCPPGRENGKGQVGCGHILNSFVSECPHCGFVFEQEAYILQQQRLEEYDPTVNPLHRSFYEAAIRECYAQDWSPGAALLKFRERYYKPPTIAVTRHALFGTEPTRGDVVDYFGWLSRIAKKKGKQLSWVKTNMSKEFGQNWTGVIAEPDRAFAAAQNGEPLLAIPVA